MTKAKFKSFWDKFGTLTILIFMMACLSIASPKYFLTLDNFKQIGLQSTVYILLAFGEFFAILLAGIDLSVGSVAALTGTFIALMLKAEVPVAVAILVGLLLSLIHILQEYVSGTLFYGSNFKDFQSAAGCTSVCGQYRVGSD